MFRPTARGVEHRPSPDLLGRLPIRLYGRGQLDNIPKATGSTVGYVLKNNKYSIFTVAPSHNTVH